MSIIKTIPDKWKSSFENGQMTSVLNCLESKKISLKNHIVTGSTCIVFNYNENSVVKVCTKNIDYFKYNKNKTINDFRYLVNSQFSGYFLPILEILHNDDNYFVYTQEK